MESKKILTTLCIVHQHPRVLLGMKKRGFGEGRWNGFGGKVGGNETIEEAAIRETREEAGIEVRELEKTGIIKFEFRGNPEFIEMHIFRSTDFEGDPQEGEEMKPQWFEVDNIPFDVMWPDDKYWIPLFLEGRKFKARFLFDDFDTILEQELKEVEKL